MKEPKFFIATKGLIVQDRKVLIIREACSYSEGTNAGRYDLPGGRLNPGENFMASLEREILEETGLTIWIGDPIAVDEWRPVVKGEPWQIVGIFFECRTKSNKIVLSTDHSEYEWIDPKEHKKYPLIENLHKVFEAYLKRAERDN